MSGVPSTQSAKLALACGIVGLVLALAMMPVRNEAHGAMPVLVAPVALGASLAALVLGARERAYAALGAGVATLVIMAVVAYRAVF